MAASRRAQRLTLLAVLPLALGCSERKLVPAVGPYSDVFLFTERGLRGELLGGFIDTLTHPVQYVFEEENEFDVFLRDQAQFPKNRDRKNILLFVRVDQPGGLLAQVQKLLGKDALERARREGHVVYYKEDFFARDQDVYFLLAGGAAGEEVLLSRMATSLRDRLRESTRARMRENLLRGRENKGGAKYLMQRYGFSLRFPSDYHLLQERPELGAIEIHCEAPSRVLGVFWDNDFGGAPTLADTLRLLAFRGDVADSLYGGDYLLAGSYRFTAVEQAGRPALRLEGVWQNERDMTGGAFVTYFFWDERRQRLLALDLLLYAPGMAKHPYMRELEALGTTFAF
ncbi:DUF4837 family protein [bacterium]|nr:DUF4837 family protein [bacterium]